MNDWTVELYSHAIAIEREAARRYAELSAAMSARGNHAAGELFRLLGSFEQRHLEELERKTAGIALPAPASDYTWRDAEAPETVPLAPAERITQRSALAAALEAERRAHAFFEHAGRIAHDADTRALAREMAAEEEQHAVLLERMLQRMPSQPVLPLQLGRSQGKR
jgi:rubrerythrin